MPAHFHVLTLYHFTPLVHTCHLYHTPTHPTPCLPHIPRSHTCCLFLHTACTHHHTSPPSFLTPPFCTPPPPSTLQHHTPHLPRHTLSHTLHATPAHTDSAVHQGYHSLLTPVSITYRTFGTAMPRHRSCPLTQYTPHPAFTVLNLLPTPAFCAHTPHLSVVSMGGRLGTEGRRGRRRWEEDNLKDEILKEASILPSHCHPSHLLPPIWDLIPTFCCTHTKTPPATFLLCLPATFHAHYWQKRSLHTHPAYSVPRMLRSGRTIASDFSPAVWHRHTAGIQDAAATHGAAEDWRSSRGNTSLLLRVGPTTRSPSAGRL